MELSEVLSISAFVHCRSLREQALRTRNPVKERRARRTQEGGERYQLLKQNPKYPTQFLRFGQNTLDSRLKFRETARDFRFAIFDFVTCLVERGFFCIEALESDALEVVAGTECSVVFFLFFACLTITNVVN